MKKKIKLRVQGLTNSQIHSSAYALVLAEENGNRRIPVIVGTAEAQSIAIAIERILTPRPLTHDLFVRFSNAFDVELKEVLIYRFLDGVFYSQLLFTNGEHKVYIDSRTSDAIAIALRMDCDIYIYEDIMDECGVELENLNNNVYEKEDDDDSKNIIDLEPEEIDDPALLKQWLSLLSVEDLQERLELAVETENYEYAKMYQEELNRRKL
ncbi:MAG: bifunctional nuclease family protein [Parabacteroides sp.]|nr:bifunctional nuclease family protein [Parabacteroides sp.]